MGDLRKGFMKGDNMERIQVYPPDELKALMDEDAKQKKVSISELTVDILMNYYGLIPKIEKKPLQEFYQKIFEEVEHYIELKIVEKDADPKEKIEFDLLTASETFRQLHMVADGKPAMNRAAVGRMFAGMVKDGMGIFRRIAPVTENGKPKKSVNRAQMYEVL